MRKVLWCIISVIMVIQCFVSQNHIYEWVRDHRVHHKFTDTDADPHNAKRGFFFSHMGWLLIRKHPDVISKGASIDMSDLEKDFVVVWQRRYDNSSSTKILFSKSTKFQCDMRLSMKD